MTISEYFRTKAQILENYQDGTDNYYGAVSSLKSLNKQAVDAGLPVDAVEESTIQAVLNNLEVESQDSSYDDEYYNSYDDSYC